MSEVYEMISTTNDDVNVLTVDFTFSSEVDKNSAVACIDNMVSMLDDSTDATAKEMYDHMPTFFTKSRWSKDEEE
jgi:transposase